MYLHLTCTLAVSSLTALTGSSDDRHPSLVMCTSKPRQGTRARSLGPVAAELRARVMVLSQPIAGPFCKKKEPKGGRWVSQSSASPRLQSRRVFSSGRRLQRCSGAGSGCPALTFKEVNYHRITAFPSRAPGHKRGCVRACLLCSIARLASTRGHTLSAIVHVGLVRGAQEFTGPQIWGWGENKPQQGLLKRWTETPVPTI